MTRFALLLLTLLLANPPAVQESVVFEGLPLKKVESSFLDTETYELNSDQSF